MPTPADALEIMEAPLVRWLYARRKPNQSFKIAFDQEIQRHLRRVGRARPQGRRRYGAARRPRGAHPRHVHRGRAAADHAAPAAVPHARLGHRHHRPATRSRPCGSVSELDPEHPVHSLDEAAPAAGPRQRWITPRCPAEQRTRVRDEPDTELLASLDERARESLRLLLDGLDEHWSLDGLTSLVYGVPKVRAGLAPDAKPHAGAEGRPSAGSSPCCTACWSAARRAPGCPRCCWRWARSGCATSSPPGDRGRRDRRRVTDAA